MFSLELGGLAQKALVDFSRKHYRGGTGEPRIFLGAAVSHLEGTKTNQRAAVWESTGPPPWLRGGIWLYPDEHNQF